MSEATTPPITSAAPPAATGDDLGALLAPLEGLEERPVEEHVAAFESVHAGLRDVLAGEGAAPEA